MAQTRLTRDIGLLALSATGICSMLGAAINTFPLMLQREVPGIGPHVLLAYLLAAVPAVFAALAYASLASAMPRAGGSYVYASRAMHPYLGFVASFSHWFGLSVAIGVVAYMLVPFLRDVAVPLGAVHLGDLLDDGGVRVAVALGFLWLFVWVNVRGHAAYARTLVPLMFVMFACGSVVIWAGFGHDHAAFTAAVVAQGGEVGPAPPAPLELRALLGGAAVLFASFIGFDSIAQAGGEARNPQRTLPLATGIAIGAVGGFYMLFTAAVYHTVPWQYVAEHAQTRDLTAPGLLAFVLSPGWGVVIIAGAAVALINDLPAMLLAVSRLMFAWAEDGVFPKAVARVHPRRHTPHIALLASGAVASAAVLGCHFARDFFVGVNLLTISMLVNFGLMCLALLALPRCNPTLADEVRFLSGRGAQTAVGLLGAATLGALLVIHVAKDLSADVAGWYFRSTWVWLLVMAVASAVFALKWGALRRSGVDTEARFSTLPPE